MTQTKLPKTLELIKQTNHFYFKNIKKIILIFLLISIPLILIQPISYFLPNKSLFQIITTSALSLIYIFLSILGSVALIILFKKPSENIKSLFKLSKKYFFSALWIGILTSIIIFIASIIATIAGLIIALPILSLIFWSFEEVITNKNLILVLTSVILAIPSIIISIYFLFNYFLLIDTNKRGWQILLESKSLVKGYWLAIFGRLAVITVIIIFIVYITQIIQIALIVLIQYYPITIIISLITPILSVLLSGYLLVFEYKIYKNLLNVKK